ncbi:MAG: carboxypeptidase-like regulatory domain-containing protein, partial [Mucilaginibacter sp.]
NTTYVINFGKAITDVNEGNILPNFTYVFSTGSHIDSLSVSGTVQNILTQEKVKDATVMLFTPKQDSTLFGKKKPTIYASTDSAGNFSLNNLHDGTYSIYALKETAPNKIYDNENELIAFQKQPIHLTKDTSGLRLILFKQEPEKLRMTDHRFDPDGKMFFTFNRSLNNPTAKIIYPAAIDQQKIVEFSKKNDTAFIYTRNMDFDSIRVSFLENNKPLDSVSLRKGRKETFTRLFTFQYNTGNNNKLKPGTDLNILSSLPIESIDNSLLTLNEDSTNISNYTLLHDTSNLKKITIKYPWKVGSRYQLIYNEGALTDIYGDKNKKALKIFDLDKADNYGVLNLKVTIPDTSKGYIVELYNEQKVLIRSDAIAKSKLLVYKNYPVGKYNVKVVYDDNRNGKWDSGSVKKKIQPENIWIYEKIITLRSNWEAEEPIDIPKEPTNP